MMFNITSVEKLISLLSNQNLRNWECDEKDKEQSKSKAKQIKVKHVLFVHIQEIGLTFKYLLC